MASWVITMSKDYPKHWEIAKQHGLWDMTSSWQIDAGDDVYFWQAGGGSFLGRTRATSDAREVIPSDRLPWQDAGEREYVARFTFDLLSAAPTSQPKWGDVLQRLSMSAMTLQAPRRFDNPADEAVLASYFDETERGTEPVDPDYSDQERERDLKKFGYDLRRYTMRAIAMREGQPEFRRGLLTAYRSRCAITGTSAEEVLEAAHISPFKGGQSHETHNGLLLRADIHTLFDRFLITVLPEHTVRVSPTLWGTDYSDLDGGQLVQVPSSREAAPDRDLLRGHNTACDWLRSGVAQRV